MAGAARFGDPDTSDGTISGAVSTDVIINGQGAAIVGSIDSPHAPHGAPHDSATIKVGSSSVIVNGQGLAFAGSDLSCGDAIKSGSDDVDIAP